MSLKPNQAVPPLVVPLVDGGTFTLADAAPQHFTLVVFYRGLHCPVCRRYLGELEKHVAQFEERGVEVLALSTDPADRAARSRKEWQLPTLRLGYGLDVDDARRWGLYISEGRGASSAGVDEPTRFAEPGVFLVRPDGRLYWVCVSSMPFARPPVEEILKGVDFVIGKDYPARGDA
ncbi:MAG: peroxiredoxin-like family protein [Casimicrobiaceae bacterium]